MKTSDEYIQHILILATDIEHNLHPPGQQTIDLIARLNVATELMLAQVEKEIRWLEEHNKLG